uniref:Uncharacterized protein n=1 Tax=Glossina pallidipes TaxID=7398 RepID=A0A1A9ZHC8_GLOPL
MLMLSQHLRAILTSSLTKIRAKRRFIQYFDIILILLENLLPPIHFIVFLHQVRTPGKSFHRRKKTTYPSDIRRVTVKPKPFLPNLADLTCRSNALIFVYIDLFLICVALFHFASLHNDKFEPKKISLSLLRLLQLNLTLRS